MNKICSAPSATQTPLTDLSRMPPDQLLSGLKTLVDRGNQLTPTMLAYLGEVDHRRLYLDAAFSSMFAFCVEVLNLSEGATCKRIAAARAARKYPLILELVSAGRLHLCGVQLLGKHLTPDTSDELLQAAAGKSKRQLEKMLAARFPAPPVPQVVRTLPRRREATTVPAPQAHPPTHTLPPEGGGPGRGAVLLSSTPIPTP